MNKRNQAYLYLVFASAIWGIALPLIKKGYEQTTPMQFLFFRYLFAVLVSLPILIILWPKIKIKAKHIPELIGIGLLANFISHILMYIGLDKTSTVETSLLGSLTPILIVLGGAFFLREKITKNEKIGIIIVFLGSLLVVLEPLFLNGQGLSFDHTLGNTMILANCFTWGGAMLWMKKVAHKYHPLGITLISFIPTTVAYLITLLIMDPKLVNLDIFSQPIALSAALFQGILGSVLALFLYQYAQREVEASEATLFHYLVPLFSIPLAIIWLHEMPSTLFIIGGLIIIIGIVIAEKRWKGKSH
ncbi:DMT family transporter [Candidatus Beckwithbacteria bacterium]|nr:DMT family transporter [Candidatus Beckwithbacteria bacterium]